MNGLPALPFTDTETWVPFEREGVHAGAFTTLSYLVRFASNRARANRFYTDEIVIIDPITGIVEGRIDLSGILPDEERTPSTNVLNGIAWDAATGRIFVTGKYWPKLFEIELVPLGK